MDNEIVYWTFAQHDAQDAHGRRHEDVQRADTSVVQNAGSRSALNEKLEEYDPAGRRSHQIAAELRRQNQ